MGMHKIVQVESETGRLSKDTNKHYLYDGEKEGLPEKTEKEI